MWYDMTARIVNDKMEAIKALCRNYDGFDNNMYKVGHAVDGTPKSQFKKTTGGAISNRHKQQRERLLAYPTHKLKHKHPLG